MQVTTVLVASVGLVTVVAAPARADEPTTVTTTSAKTIGIDGGIAMPTGTWGDAAGFGFGALARFEYTMSDKLVLSARAGFIQHLAKEVDGGFGATADSSTSEIPLLGGARYAFSRTPTTAIYGAAELGFVVYRASIEADGMSQSGSDTNLGMSLGAGYRTGKLDVRGALLFPDAGELVDVMAVMATVGYDITAL